MGLGQGAYWLIYSSQLSFFKYNFDIYKYDTFISGKKSYTIGTYISTSK